MSRYTESDGNTTKDDDADHTDCQILLNSVVLLLPVQEFLLDFFAHSCVWCQNRKMKIRIGKEWKRKRKWSFYCVEWQISPLFASVSPLFSNQSSKFSFLSEWLGISTHIWYQVSNSVFGATNRNEGGNCDLRRHTMTEEMKETDYRCCNRKWGWRWWSVCVKTVSWLICD